MSGLIGVDEDESQRLFREGFRTFLQREIVPFFKKWEQERQIPREVWKRFGEMGYLCPWVDEEYGGSGTDFSYSAIMIAEMAHADLDIPISVHSDIIVPYIARLGTQEQKQRWLPKAVRGELITSICMTEPDTGSDLAAVSTTAVKDGDNYVLNGRKMFITIGWDADLYVVVAKTGQNVNPHHNLSLIVVERTRPGVEPVKKLDKMGRHTEGTAEMLFDHVRVPRGNLLGEEGKGFYYLMQNLQQERLVIALQALAEAELMFEEALEYAKQRKAFGQAIGTFQANAFKLAEMATELELGRTFVNRLVEEHVTHKEIVTEVSMAKWWCTEMANRVAYQALQLFGGYGYMEETPIAHQYRNIRVETIFGGTTETMKSIIAKRLGLA